MRVYLSMIRALARDLDRGDEIADVRIPRHEPGPPETLTDADYQNLLRVSDRRTVDGFPVASYSRIVASTPALAQPGAFGAGNAMPRTLGRRGHQGAAGRRVRRAASRLGG